jgi:hypothetical protein|nr:MAG TPA: hypothetical protein [Caudoviricetes sp.]
MSIIKNIDGSTNSILNELNVKINSDDRGYNQSDAIIDYICKHQIENKRFVVAVRDREPVQTLLNLFIPNFNMDDLPSKFGYNSIILFRNKVDREMSNIQFILQMLYQFDPKSRVVIKYPENIKLPQKEHLSIKACLESFAYKQRYSFCSKIGDFSFKIQPVGYGTFFKTIFSYSSSDKEKLERFLEESNIINFIKRNKDYIKLL